MRDYTTRDVAELLELPVRQVRAFARDGLVEAGRGPRNEYRFDFQDLVLLRTAAGLSAAGIPMGRIRRALSTLKDELPAGRSLSEVRITAAGDRVVVHEGGTAWEPGSDQLVLSFDVSELAARVEPLARGVVEAEARDEAGRIAQDWYDAALELEPYAPDEARQAYRKALELDPGHLDAHLNLGCLLHEEGRTEDAETEYRRALALDAAYATAAFNLGTALEDLDRPTDAIQAYEQAISADPTLADAHFNLSRLYEATGDKLAALRHLKRYKELLEAGA